jgi:hypothetical protein
LRSSATLKTKPSDYLPEASRPQPFPDDPETDEDDPDATRDIEGWEAAPPDELVAAPDVVPTEALAEALAARTQEFLSRKDSHKFFRSLVVNGIHKNCAYSSWPADFRKQFDARFNELLTNTNFIREVCRKVVNFAQGPVVSEKGAASLASAIAGFVALYMIKVE